MDRKDAIRVLRKSQQFYPAYTATQLQQRDGVVYGFASAWIVMVYRQSDLEQLIQAATAALQCQRDLGIVDVEPLAEGGD